MLLHQLFEASARREPEAIALERPPSPDQPERLRWSYADLWAWSGRIAARLGPVAADDPVAILLPREAPALYAAQLGVLRAGGAFLCLDPAQPDRQLARILADARPVALLGDPAALARLEGAGLTISRAIQLETAVDRLVPGTGGEDSGPARAAADPPSAVPPAPPHPDPPSDPPADGSTAIDAADRRLAYLIYTSGSTGAPKGVMIEHRGIVELVRSDLAHFDLGPGDRVAQVSSPAYDSSIEEAWLAFASGATLVLLDALTLRLGPDLPAWLRHERITVLCPPPTLLSSMACADPAADLPELRLLYVGGEALPPELADAWARGRRMVNGYGPTECSVTALRAEVEPGRPVRIGWPVAGNRAWVLGPDGAELPDGIPGELCIGGPCLARGYLGRPEETAARFVLHPGLGRIYHTGDRARRGPEGFDFLGRLDDQVKLRGHRIELGAVEVTLAGLPGLRAAACRLQGTGARQLLAAHLVAEDPADPPALEAIREALRERLPEPMIPARFAFRERLPTSLGGKLDRRALPEIPAEARAPTHSPTAADDPIADPLTARIASAFALALERDLPPGPEDDFFLDLGGDSLAAVAVILALREAEASAGAAAAEPIATALAGQLARVTVRDLYAAPSPGGLAGRLRRSGTGEPSDRAVDRGAGPAPVPPPRRPIELAGFTGLQILWLALGLAPASLLGWWLAFELLPWLLAGLGLGASILALSLLSAAGRLLGLPLALGSTLLAKRALIGRYRPGPVPAFGLTHARHWMVSQTARLLPWGLVAGTALAPWMLRRLGARVGRGVHIQRGSAPTRGGWDLITIGEGASLARDAEPRPMELSAGRLIYGPIEIGAGAALEPRAGMSPGARIGAGARLEALSWLPGGAELPAGQRGAGVPARALGPDSEPLHAEDAPLGAPRQALLLVGGRLLLGQLPWLLAAPALWLLERARPGLTPALLAWLESPRGGWVLPAALLLPALGPLLVLPLRALALRLLGPVPAGCHHLDGATALRAQLQMEQVEAAGRRLSGSMLWPWWLRAAGMRIGPRSEISSIHEVLPGRIAIGAECFFADGVYLCPPELRGGVMHVRDSRIGDRTFLGNHAHLPAGARWPDDLFVGAATPADPATAVAGSSWFGLPPMRLPRREVVEIDRRLTYEPTLARRAERAFWELLRLFLPGLPWLVASLWYLALARSAARLEAPTFLGLALPGLSLLAISLPVLATLALKWLLLGRVQPGRHAFWSSWCGRWDLVYMAWNAWARGPLLALEGSLLLHPVLRAFGMRIGRQVLLGRGFAQVVDPDMLRFDDGATVDCHFQAHSFEDRVLKIDRLRLGPGATVGAQTVVFYGVEVGAGAEVAPQGVIMKGDRVPPGSRQSGSPLQAWPDEGDDRRADR